MRMPMLSEFAPYVGGIAAILASLSSYLPQLRKALPRDFTKDLSLWTLVALTLGLGLWVVYGILRYDWVLTCANLVGAGLTGIVLVCKIRDQ
jgi:MtN3 and saliva related transmembrane protein